MKIQFRDLPESFQNQFRTLWVRSNADMFTPTIALQVFHQMTDNRFTVQYEETNYDNIDDDYIIFENEYEYTLFLLTI